MTKLKKDKSMFLKKENTNLTKNKVGRKRLFTFQDLEAEDSTLIDKTKKHIQELVNEIEGQPLIPLNRWCEERDINPATMVRLFNDADLPVIRISNFQGVYKVHLDRVFKKESERQVQQQIQNKVCARVLTTRQHKERGRKQEISA